MKLSMILVLTSVVLSACAHYQECFIRTTYFGPWLKVNPKENKPVDANLGYDRGCYSRSRTKEKRVVGHPETDCV
jgi:hypothetical protein